MSQSILKSQDFLNQCTYQYINQDNGNSDGAML